MDYVVLRLPSPQTAVTERALFAWESALFKGPVRYGGRALDGGKETGSADAGWLDASLGKSWLHVKGNPEHARESFEEGSKKRSHETRTIYVGLDAAMS